jgi:hypothetical protein
VVVKRSPRFGVKGPLKAVCFRLKFTAMTPHLRALGLLVAGLALRTYAGPYDIPADGDLNVQGHYEGRGHSVTYVSGGYSLWEGILSKNNIGVEGAYFRQSGGTNIVHGGLRLSAGWFQDRTSYTLTGGLLVTSNASLGQTVYGGFVHAGGVHILRNSLSVYQSNYGLGGGLLKVKDIWLGANGSLSHSGGKLKHTGLLALAGGTWRFQVGAERVGPLQLLSSSTNSNLMLPVNKRATIHFADSSALPWDSDAQLVIYSWRGSTSVRSLGWNHIYFGSNSRALTTQQLAQITFRNPYGAPGDYPARLRANGELVPTR